MNESGSRMRWLIREGMKFAALPVFVAALALLANHGEAAPGNSAIQILKRMSGYIADQKAILVTVDTDVEVVTTDLQKIQFASSGQLLLNRPNKIRASRTGGYVDMELIFDGKRSASWAGTSTPTPKSMRPAHSISSPSGCERTVASRCRLRTCCSNGLMTSSRPTSLTPSISAAV